jgi:hypothetical protein
MWKVERALDAATAVCTECAALSPGWYNRWRMETGIELRVE